MQQYNVHRKGGRTDNKTWLQKNQITYAKKWMLLGVLATKNPLNIHSSSDTLAKASCSISGDSWIFMWFVLPTDRFLYEMSLQNLWTCHGAAFGNWVRCSPEMWSGAIVTLRDSGLDHSSFTTRSLRDYCYCFRNCCPRSDNDKKIGPMWVMFLSQNSSRRYRFFEI